GIPVLKNLLIRCGAIRANYENAYMALDEGHKVVIFPGGNHEAFRKFTDRFRVDFAGHKGFARVALAKNVPIVPHVNVGGQETFFVLSTGAHLAKLLHTDKLLRSKTCAVSLALPFGLSIGPGFHFPLPAKTEIEVCDPIYPDRATERVEGTEAKIDRLYELTVASMQKTMDKIAKTRRFPVIG
ncbi:MAG: glycerol acyltransferase, partial [Myxococcota bacterium]